MDGLRDAADRDVAEREVVEILREDRDNVGGVAEWVDDADIVAHAVDLARLVRERRSRREPACDLVAVFLAQHDADHRAARLRRRDGIHGFTRPALDLVEERSHVARAGEVFRVMHDRVDVHEMPMQLRLLQAGAMDRVGDSREAEIRDEDVRCGVVALLDHRMRERVDRYALPRVIGVQDFRAADEVAQFEDDRLVHDARPLFRELEERYQDHDLDDRGRWKALVRVVLERARSGLAHPASIDGDRS